MSVELFIARRIYAEKTGEGERFSRPAIRIAMVGVAIGVAVMLVSLAVVLGFKHEVSEKVIGFGSHIQVVSLIIIGFIIWMAVKSFRRYQGRYVDSEKSNLIEEAERLKETNARLKEVNARLTKRNQELAEKVAQLRDQPTMNTSTNTTSSYTSDTTW